MAVLAVLSQEEGAAAGSGWPQGSGRAAGRLLAVAVQCSQVIGEKEELGLGLAGGYEARRLRGQQQQERKQQPWSPGQARHR